FMLVAGGAACAGLLGAGLLGGCCTASTAAACLAASVLVSLALSSIFLTAPSPWPQTERGASSENAATSVTDFLNVLLAMPIPCPLLLRRRSAGFRLIHTAIEGGYHASGRDR